MCKPVTYTGFETLDNRDNWAVSGLYLLRVCFGFGSDSESEN
jgi:hypothetical protein